MSIAVSDDLGIEITAELRGEFADRVPVAVIRSCVRAAMSDLRGSIRAEALPEMAVRLAHARLTKLISDRAHSPAS